MADRLTFRQKLLQLLALLYDLSFKEIGARCGMTERNVSHHLRRQRRRDEMKDDIFERLLSAIPCPPAAVSFVAECIESVAALSAHGDLTEEERAEIEEAGRSARRLTREALSKAALRTRAVRVEGYPEPHEVDLDRRQAEELFRRLSVQPPPIRLALVRVVDRYQTWALCERACEASVREASRDLESAAVWASVAREIAVKVRGPEWWQHRVQGFAGGFGANVVRVQGELKPAAADFVSAKRLWLSGADPLGLLDPGRMLDLEASLLRDQRHFDEALACLDEAVIVGRSPERALINKGFTLEVMGEYERAIEALLLAAPMIEHTAEPRLRNTVDFNLASACCNAGRHSEAAGLVPRIRALAIDLGDHLDLIRLGWLEGRIASGQGRREEALNLLAQARWEFAERKMSFDVALTLLEEAVLLLEDGRVAEVKRLAQELEKVFESKGVHREALEALLLFREAAEREAATPELARRVLRFLFRARHDRGLRFES